ncbi:ABC-F family ATP-binding cassette domain-containing protein [Desulfoluna sp.]|uniref:ABC-F family ATP-binding cassette domain-containing protein n=1 Tax=Desulfoluna sp. TaxID=2045199 RepID=UPI00262E5F13|nr:ABC-F family ATP-binding cassette domain-containing protein [Desulfoluna sp.]
MLNLENITKSYGGRQLFDDVSFKVNSRERVGLVGRNGHGKTTLFRLITGEEEADSGQVAIPKNYRLGYVTQHIRFTEETVLQEAALGLPDHESDQLWKVEKILAGLGFSEEAMGKNPGDFSGGFQVRLNLARVLVSDPDLLLLDEPTNYLDITSIRWIEGFLNSWPRELLLITHDRGFMDRVVTHTVGIHRGRVRKVAGNTEACYTQIAQEEEIYEKTRLNDEKKRKEMELFISRFRAKARLANMVQSRVKTLNKMEKHDKLSSLETLGFSFRSCPIKGRQLYAAKNLTFGYGNGPELIQNFSLTLGRRERICVVGQNGRGKTTLLKLLAGELLPKSGTIELHPSSASGFYEQTNVSSINPMRTVEEEVLSAHPDVERQQARNICGAMMFEGDQALKKCSVLSGGEKSRVMLGKLLVTPLNLLFLDEPTNHLDMESCDSLMAAVDNFDGTVVMVTHNEMFLHAVATRLVVFRNGGVELFDGTYSEFLEKVGWGDDPEGNVSETLAMGPDEALASASKKSVGKKENRRLRSSIISRRNKVTAPLRKKIEAIEESIDASEKEIDRINDALLEATQAGDVAVITALSKDLYHHNTSIDEGFEALETLTEELDRLEASFNAELEELGGAV